MSWCRGAAVGLRVGGQAYDSVAGQRVKMLGLITASGSFTLFGNRCFIEYRIRKFNLMAVLFVCWEQVIKLVYSSDLISAYKSALSRRRLSTSRAYYASLPCLAMHIGAV